jgi:hypothetical protein
MSNDEMRLANYHLEYLKKQRKHFEYADISQSILEEQNDDDLLVLQDWLTNVHSKLKVADERRNEVLLLIKSLWRIQSYCGGLVTVCKGGNSRLHIMEKRILELESEKKILHLKSIQDKAKHEIEKDKLGKEIEFLTKNG